MPLHVEAAVTHRVSFIQGYSSAVYELARWLEFHPAPGFTEAVRGVQLFSESADEGMVALIERVFGCPVLVHYGHSERAVMAGSMPDDRSTHPGKRGRSRLLQRNFSARWTGCPQAQHGILVPLEPALRQHPPAARAAA